MACIGKCAPAELALVSRAMVAPGSPLVPVQRTSVARNPLFIRGPFLFPSL